MRGAAFSISILYRYLVLKESLSTHEKNNRNHVVKIQTRKIETCHRVRKVHVRLAERKTAPKRDQKDLGRRSVTPARIDRELGWLT